MLTVLHQHINDVFRSCSYQRASLQVIRWFLLMIILCPDYFYAPPKCGEYFSNFTSTSANSHACGVTLSVMCSVVVLIDDHIYAFFMPRRNVEYR